MMAERKKHRVVVQMSNAAMMEGEWRDVSEQASTAEGNKWVRENGLDGVLYRVAAVHTSVLVKRRTVTTLDEASTLQRVLPDVPDAKDEVGDGYEEDGVDSRFHDG